jgi:transposase
MKQKVTNKEIAEIIGKNEQTIKGWKSRFPELLEVVRLGTLCKINNLDKEKIIKLVELQETILSNK